jgi:hypothetical protein
LCVAALDETATCDLKSSCYLNSPSLIYMGPTVKINTWFAALVAAILLNGSANASVFSVFSVDPGPITVGGTGELDLTLNLSADPGATNAKFSGGLVTLGSGAGDIKFFSVTPGTTSQNFTWDFTYPVAGTFHPFFAFAVGYTEKFGFGPFSITVPVPALGLGASTLTVEAAAAAPAVPEASTWVMMLLGFAGLGLMMHRRKAGLAQQIA